MEEKALEGKESKTARKNRKIRFSNLKLEGNNCDPAGGINNAGPVGKVRFEPECM
jgi:hypothetical protein